MNGEDRGSSTLIDAVKAGDLAAVRTIVQDRPELAGARLPTGESPVMAAMYRGHHAIVDALIEAGAEIDVFAAAATGRTDELRQALSDRQAVRSFAYDGWTALHLSAFFGHADAARLLLDAGADVHAVSRNTLANTPLHAATAGKHSDVALLLLAAGADPHVLDSGGHTAERIASENQLASVVEAIAARQR